MKSKSKKGWEGSPDFSAVFLAKGYVAAKAEENIFKK